MERSSGPLGRFTTLVALVVCTSCTSTFANDDTTTLGPGPKGREPTLCNQACEVWFDLGCPQGEKICDHYSSPGICESWLTCESWCRQAETKGSQPMNLSCVVEKKDEVSSCESLEETCAY